MSTHSPTQLEGTSVLAKILKEFEIFCLIYIYICICIYIYIYIYICITYIYACLPACLPSNYVTHGQEKN